MRELDSAVGVNIHDGFCVFSASHRLRVGPVGVVRERAEKVPSGEKGGLFVDFREAGGPPSHENDDELRVFKADV